MSSLLPSLCAVRQVHRRSHFATQRSSSYLSGLSSPGAGGKRRTKRYLRYPLLTIRRVHRRLLYYRLLYHLRVILTLLNAPRWRVGDRRPLSNYPPYFQDNAIGEKRGDGKTKKRRRVQMALGRARRARNPARHERDDVPFPVRRASNAREGRASVL